MRLDKNLARTEKANFARAFVERCKSKGLSESRFLWSAGLGLLFQFFQWKYQSWHPKPHLVRQSKLFQSHFFLEAIYLIQNKYYQIETTTTVPSIKKTDFLKSKYSFPETPSILLFWTYFIISQVTSGPLPFPNILNHFTWLNILEHRHQGRVLLMIKHTVLHSNTLTINRVSKQKKLETPAVI